MIKEEMQAMQTNYHDEKGNIRKELLNQEAEKQANGLIVKRYDRRRQQEVVDDKKSVSSTQLRRFYNEFKGLEKRIRAKDFESVLPLIKMVRSRAFYASNGNKIPRSFKDFLVKNVEAINKKKDFDAFLLHFEAVVGFCYGMGLKK
ncbi:MAG: type III-A CRISPR-associated protein Csm2 [Thermodesulfobacteriota bacterium]|nr:MAG: type III-A CRISPR-associated protein Csm2 [Thermodesulfobacteriota bacterium]